MALFKSSNPEKAVQRDIDAATANRERLSPKLAEAEQAVARHAAAAKQAALTGDDAELDRAEASQRAAQDRSATLRTVSPTWSRSWRLSNARRPKSRIRRFVPRPPPRSSLWSAI
jgi:septal ring factor EnvC (AmiA/AmiB activator)